MLHFTVAVWWGDIQNQSSIKLTRSEFTVQVSKSSFVKGGWTKEGEHGEGKEGKETGNRRSKEQVKYKRRGREDGQTEERKVKN